MQLMLCGKKFAVWFRPSRDMALLDDFKRALFGPPQALQLVPTCKSAHGVWYLLVVSRLPHENHMVKVPVTKPPGYGTLETILWLWYTRNQEGATTIWYTEAT